MTNQEKLAKAQKSLDRCEADVKFAVSMSGDINGPRARRARAQRRVDRCSAELRFDATMDFVKQNIQNDRRLETRKNTGCVCHSHYINCECGAVPEHAREVIERMVSGKDKGWCTNFATIFVHACNCLGIPARLVGMGQIHSLSDKCKIQRGGSHSTSEIFDDASNQWVWMDISFYALGAYLGEEGPLNMA